MSTSSLSRSWFPLVLLAAMVLGMGGAFLHRQGAETDDTAQNQWRNYQWRMTVPDTVPDDYLPGGLPDGRLDDLLQEQGWIAELDGISQEQCAGYVQHHPEDGWLRLVVNGKITSTVETCDMANQMVWVVAPDYLFMVRGRVSREVPVEAPYTLSI